jgi:hypothetical protein
MSRHALAAALLVAFAAPLVSAAPKQPKKKPARVAVKAAPELKAKTENQFVTVEDFLRARRANGTPVSVEGYAVVGTKTASGVKLALVDSVDHVLNASDANKFAAGGATALIPASSIAKRATWGMIPKGMTRFAMYTGAGKAQKELHDIVPKVRITGRAAARTINVTGVEFADDNGEWKKL